MLKNILKKMTIINKNTEDATQEIAQRREKFGKEWDKWGVKKLTERKLP
jgi:hypothetical protein